MWMYKSAIDFSTLILQQHLNSLISSNSIFVCLCVCACVFTESSDFLHRRLYHQGIKIVYLFPWNMDVFIAFNCLITWIFLSFFVYIMFAPTSIAASGSNDVSNYPNNYTHFTFFFKNKYPRETAVYAEGGT